MGNIQRYIAESREAKAKIRKKLAGLLPQDYKLAVLTEGQGNKTKETEIIFHPHNSAARIALATESTFSQSDVAEKFLGDFHINRVLNHLSVPVRKIEDGLESIKWDLYIKYNLKQDGFFAITYDFLIRYGRPGKYSNVSEHIRPNNNQFIILDWTIVDKVEKLDKDYMGHSVICNDTEKLSYLIKTMVERKGDKNNVVHRMDKKG